jgi:outer membrane protein OmpA-like peptidoglycan-associated protein
VSAASSGGGIGRWILIGILALIALLVPTVMLRSWQTAAASRLAEAEAAVSEEPQVAIAAEADEEYCTPALRTVLRRVLTSCGLISGGGRGCQPADARSVATMSGDDFNALFLPMRERGGILQFERSSTELDLSDTTLIDRVFADRRGASYFFVVARASPDGSVETNTELSRQRAETVMSHLEATFHDPELRSQVGLLWLGEEFAQLDPTFCEWQRSGAAGVCTPEELNRSAFVAWIDCRL